MAPFHPEPKDATGTQFGFVPAKLVPDPQVTPDPIRPASSGAIEIEFAAGIRMRITGAVDATTPEGCCRSVGGWTNAKIPIPSGVRAWIATGHTDMRRGMQSLALAVQQSLKRDPHDRGNCILPSASDGAVSISAGQMAYMLEGSRPVRRAGGLDELRRHRLLLFNRWYKVSVVPLPPSRDAWDRRGSRSL